MTDKALKTRIITHMNADHARSLHLFAEHYSHLPTHEATTATLSDITLDHVILNTSKHRLLIPFSPPLPSFSTARERLVAMHNDSLTSLNLSEHVITTYRKPYRWWEWFSGIAVFLIIFTFPFRSMIHPDSNSWISSLWSFGGLAPWHAKLAWYVAPLVLPMVWVIHVTEVVWWMAPRMRRHGVRTGSAVWWCWMVDCFFEGGGAWLRVDEMVREMEAAKAKKVPVGRGGKGEH